MSNVVFKEVGYDMRRGTTPTHCFSLPVKAENVDKIYITYSQIKTIKFEKTKPDVSLKDNDDGMSCMAEVSLNQNDTLELIANVDCNIQIRFVTTVEEAFASQIICEPVEDILKEGEI